VAAIVRRARDERPVVVVSAMGDTTDRLVAVLDRAARGEDEGAAEVLGALARSTAAVTREFFGSAAEALDRRIAGISAELERMARRRGAAVGPCRQPRPLLAHGERMRRRLSPRR
jgi:aspartokinase